MRMTSKSILRLQFLCRVVIKERRHLTVTDERLFVTMGFGLDQSRRLECDADLSGRVELFVGRFARLHDTLGDKLLPEILRALGEPVGPDIDTLGRGKRLGLLASADEWLVMRNFRNQMVHQYVEDLVTLTDALQAAHAFIPALILATKNMTAGTGRRGWVAN